MRRGLRLTGRYTLEEILGRGGMGEVWQARDERLQRAVAIKILPQAGDGEREAVERFRREAQITAALSHPGITTVFDVDEHADEAGNTLLFLVMELLRGTDLRTVIADHPTGLPIERATDHARQILDALGAAHSEDVVHRDIKPGNLFLTTGERIKVCDFGIARLADAARLTATGTIAGTPLYMAPEQIQARPLDQRADLYAFGCVLYELLTGTPWLDTGTGVAALLHQQLHQTPPAPSRRRPELPAHLDHLVLDLLAKDPDDRPHDAATALARLNDAPTAANGAHPATVRLRTPENERPPFHEATTRPPSAALTLPDTPVAATAADNPPPALPVAPGFARRHRTAIAIAVAVAVAATTVAVVTRHGTAPAGPSILPLQTGETASGTVLGADDVAKIPYLYDSSYGTGAQPTYRRTTLAITIASVMTAKYPATASFTAKGATAPDTHGYTAYCITYILANPTQQPVPQPLPTNGAPPPPVPSLGALYGGTDPTPFDVQGKPRLLLEAVLDDGTITTEQGSGFTSLDCRPGTTQALALGIVASGGTDVLVPEGKHPVGVIWTERTGIGAAGSTHPYTVRWNGPWNL
ncbi:MULTISPECIES: protein kinase [unclassified Kitasatospora]|uniref:serine/threonine-protein kinase n=1 Tax=unclassified Kitasatospora TaxID=2633591 RepID=UPI0033F4FAE5